MSNKLSWHGENSTFTDDVPALLKEASCDIKSKTKATDVIVIVIKGLETRINWNVPVSHENYIVHILEDVASQLKIEKKDNT